MPYIPQEDRELLINKTLKELGELEVTAGEFNFIISYIASRMTLNFSKTYANMSAIRGAILDAADEYYRRVMSPYEDLKAEVNGDVY